MFQPSPLDFVYPSTAEIADESRKNLLDYSPDLSKTTVLMQGAKQDLLGLGHFALGVGADVVKDQPLGEALDRVLPHVSNKADPYFRTHAVLQAVAHQQYLDSAGANEKAADITRGHPFLGLLANVPAFTIGTTATGGVLGGIAEGAAADSAMALLGKTATRILGKSGEKAAATGLANEVAPATFSTAEGAATTSINEAKATQLPGFVKGTAFDMATQQPILAQQSLQTDRNGNVYINPENLEDNESMSIPLTLFGESVKDGYKARNAARLAKLEKVGALSKAFADDPITEDMPEQGEAISTPQPYKSVDEIPNTTDIQAQADEAGRTHTMQDLDLPQSEAFTSTLNIPTGMLDKSNLHLAGNAVRELKENGIRTADGQIVDPFSPSFKTELDQNIKDMNEKQFVRGSQKVALTKTIENASRALREKWAKAIDSAVIMPWRNKGSELTGESHYFYQFYPNIKDGFDPEMVKQMRQSDDIVGRSLLALHDLSSTHNFESNLHTLKALRANIRLHDAGILDALDNWGKNDDEMLENFIKEAHAEFADHFTNPYHSLYLKKSAKRPELFKSLIGCLLGSM